MRLNGHVTEVDTLRDLVRVRGALGDKPLLIVDDERLTYAEADARGNRLGNALRALGVGKGDVVAAYLYNSVDQFVLWMACVKIGAIWAPLNISLVGADLAHAVTSCAPAVVVVDQELLGNYRAAHVPGDAARILRVFAGDAAPPGWTSLAEVEDTGADTEPEVRLSPRDPVAVIFTGGTTGLPKGVLITHAYCLAGSLRYREMFAPTPDDVHLGVGQMFHAIGSVVDVVCPMYSSMTSVMTRWFSASRFWPAVRRHGCTISVLLSAVIVALAARDREPADGENPLRIAGSVTGGMDPDRVAAFADRFGVRLLELYGQTETGAPCCIGQRLADPPYESQGRGYGWADVAIEGPDGRCAPGVEGEILIRLTEPATFMAGYRGAPGQFVERCQDLWFHTGDTGYLDAGGNLRFTGRLAHKIRRRGENVSAAEVERAILDDPSVRDCCVIGVPVEDGDEAVKAFIVAEPGHDPDPVAILARCSARLAYFKVPRYLQFVTELPRSASKGDVLRHVLREWDRAGEWDREAHGVEVRNRAFQR